MVECSWRCQESCLALKKKVVEGLCVLPCSAAHWSVCLRVHRFSFAASVVSACQCLNSLVVCLGLPWSLKQCWRLTGACRFVRPPRRASLPVTLICWVLRDCKLTRSDCCDVRVKKDHVSKRDGDVGTRLLWDMLFKFCDDYFVLLLVWCVCRGSKVVKMLWFERRQMFRGMLRFLSGELSRVLSVSRCLEHFLNGVQWAA